MAEDTVTTAVDDLLEYLKGKEKVAMQDVATILNIPLETLQAWVDFLVEEKILGIEYKFTKPFIYLNKESADPRTKSLRTAVSLDQVRQEYVEHAKAKQIPEAKVVELWKAHVADALERKREYFLEQASRRRMAGPDALWQRYKASILARC